MGFRPRTEITSLFASLMGRLTASLSGRLTAFLPQITKPVGPVMATGVLTVARFVGKVGCYLLVASLSGRLRASLSGRLTAFHPPDHKAGGSRHCDGGAHGGEICWESRMLPLGCESLGTPQGVPLGTPHGVPPPRSQSRRVPSSRRGCSRWRDLLGKSEVTSWSRVSRDASGHPSRDASRRSTPQITKPVGPNKGRNVPDVRTPACMKAPEVPPLTVRLRSNHRENSREAIKILGGGLGPR